MIVRMSKVEIVGPRDLLKRVISFLRDVGIFHIEPDIVGFVEKRDEKHIELFLPDKDDLSERIFLEDLKSKVEELFSYLPAVHLKSRFIEPRVIIDSIKEILQRHLLLCRGIYQKREVFKKELSELCSHGPLLDALEPLLKGVKKMPDIDFIGLVLKDPGIKQQLGEFLMWHTGGKFELLTSTASDGTTVGLITVSKDLSARVKNLLGEKDIPEMKFPPSFNNLTFIEKVRFLKDRIAEISGEIELFDMQLESFLIKWGPIYKRVREWLDKRLSVLKAATSVFETRMCFIIYGWMASGDVNNLGKQLNENFEGKVILKELGIKEEDIERMPVMLKNPAYFQPFEIFTRILPLPRYTSYDPTPFIGIFFPLFFGMMLGDAGYGLLLIILSLLMIKRFQKNRNISDAFKILSVAALYSFIFGILYGEFFGNLGHGLFGLRPLFIDRQHAVIPMLYFTVTVGVVHVLLGSFLGFAIACRRKIKKEAICRLINIMIILCILSFVASLFGLFPALLTKPIVLVIIILTPFLLFTGGLLAPLEIIKSIGNIVSYARIMAIGLTSVLLAFVANRLAGMTGDIIIGVAVAGLLHLLNIIIGVFSPTIHSLRLHYVEFFTKFIEPGGKKFEPLKK